jgi:hypothetical protein
VVNRPAAEVHRLSPGVSIWHRYDSQVKADLFSTLVATASGSFLVDPISHDADPLGIGAGGEKVEGIVVTNANHLRATPAFAEQFSVPIYAAAEAEISTALQIADGQRLSPDLTVSGIEGAAPGEVALYWEGEGGTLIIGDALINFGSHGFTLLPAKYCSNPKLMRKSLRRLLEFSFERMLFAHGTPIITGARDRLITLLDG